MRACVWCTHLCRFEHQGVSSSEASSTLPRQHHKRVVPWDDNGTHTVVEAQNKWINSFYGSGEVRVSTMQSSMRVHSFYPRGSLLVKVRLRLGRAWLMGIVLPCNKITACVASARIGVEPFLNHSWCAWMLTYLDLVTPACKVSEGLDGHAHMCLEGECVHSSWVDGLDGGQLLLVFLHQVCKPGGWGGQSVKMLCWRRRYHWHLNILLWAVCLGSSSVDCKGI